MSIHMTKFCAAPGCEYMEAAHDGGALGHPFAPGVIDDGIDWTDLNTPTAMQVPEAGREQPKRTWKPVDLTSILDGSYEEIVPTVGGRRDGVQVLYRGRMHSFVAESEAGKTWLALLFASQEIASGYHVLYVDFEDEAPGVVGRLIKMGCRTKDIADYFHYVRPEEALGPVEMVDLGEVLALEPTLAVVDGITEGMGLHGLDPLNNKDVASFGRRVLRPLQDSGAAVVSLDHVTKSSDGRGRYALGGVHKLNGINGAQFILSSVAPHGVGLMGRTRLYIAKDRPAQLRRHALPGNEGLFWFGDMTVNAEQPDAITVTVWEPSRPSEEDPEESAAAQAEAEEERRRELANQYRQKVVRLLKKGELNLSSITTALGARKQDVSTALSMLSDEGAIQCVPGPRGSLLFSLPAAEGGEEEAA